MNSILKSVWAQFGAVGLLIIFLIFVVRTQDERSAARDIRHAAERQEWRQQSEKQFESMHKVSTRSTEILSEIKTMVQLQNN